MRPVRTVFAVSLLALSAIAIAPQARAADVVITEEARTHFAAGVALLQDPKAPRYEEAYREFKAAYSAAPSYKILGNLGLCAMKIERDAEAIHAYETYLKEAGAEVTNEQREQVKRDLLTLKAGMLEVSVASEPPGATIVDVRNPIEGGDIRNAYGEALTPMTLALRHGHHVITARLAGYIDQQWEFDATAAPAPLHTFTMVKPPLAEGRFVHERPIPTSAFVSGGATVALAIGGTVVGILALKKHAEFVNDNKVGTAQGVQQAQDDQSTGKRLNVVTDVLLGGVIVGAAVTTYFVLTRGTVERAALAGAREDVGLMPAVSPLVDAHGGGVDARWRF